MMPVGSSLLPTGIVHGSRCAANDCEHRAKIRQQVRITGDDWCSQTGVSWTIDL